MLAVRVGPCRRGNIRGVGWTVALLGVLVGAAWLRFFQAGAQEIWGDEGAKLEVVTQGPAWLFNPAAEVHPRAFHSLLYLWYAVFGFNAFGLKTLPALLGVLGVAIHYAVARRVTGDRAIALAVAALTAIAPFHVWYSQDLTQYTLLMVAVGLSWLALWRALERPDAFGSWALYALAGALVIHTHYYGAFALLAQTSGVLVTQPRRLRVMIPAQLVTLALVVPWLIGQWGLLTGQAAARENFLGVERLIQVLGTGLQAFTVGLTAPAPLVPLMWVYLALAGGGAWALWRRRSAEARMLLAWGLMPIPFVFVLTGFQSYFSERFLSMIFLPLLMLVAAGLGALGWGRWGGVLMAGLGVVAALALQAAFFDPAYTKANYGAMFRVVEARAQPGDIVWLNGPDQRMLFEIYKPANVPAAWIDRGRLLSDAEADAHLADLARGHQRVWLVMFGPPPIYDPDQRAEAWLGRHGYKAYYDSFLGHYLTLYVLQQDGPGPAPVPALDRVGVRFSGGPELVAARVEPLTVSPGESVRVTLEWRTQHALSISYSVFTHLLGPEGQLVAQSDSIPVGGTRPMTGWAPGETVRDQLAIVVPVDAETGAAYTVRVGLYDLATLERAVIVTPEGDLLGADGVILAEIQVVRPPAGWSGVRAHVGTIRLKEP